MKTELPVKSARWSRRCGRLVIGMTALALAGAVQAATYYGRGDAANGCKNGNMSSPNIKWYSDVSCADQYLVDPQPQPLQVGDGSTYVFKTSLKFEFGPTFANGTHVEMGDKNGAFAFEPNCNSTTWNLPDCTLYGFIYRPNWASGGKFNGNYKVVKTAQPIIFGANSLPTGRTYGEDLSGTFTGEADAVISFDVVFGDVQAGGVCQSVISGDFSGYKGKFETRVPNRTPTGEGRLSLELNSASAFGDRGAPCTDAVTLRHAAHLSLTDDVVQSAERGITFALSSTQYAALRAESGKSWTLTAPTCGADGTLRKAGAGTVTLAGNMSVTNLEVTAGTLVFGKGSTFTPGSKLTVRAGAQVLVQRSAGLSDFASVVCEEGGEIVHAVPYSAATRTATPLEISAAEAALLAWPMRVRLTEKLALPVNAATNFCVIKFAADCSRNFAPEDFILVDSQTCGLPAVSFTLEPDGEGRTCVLLNQKPCIGQIGQRWGMASRSVSGGTEYIWTDHEKEHAGADYYTLKELGSYNGGRILDGSNIPGTWTFAGDSVTIAGTNNANQSINDYCENLLVNDLRLGAFSQLIFIRASGGTSLSGGVRDRTVSGSLTILDSAALGSEASFVINNCHPDREDLNRISASLHGCGTLRFGTWTASTFERPHKWDIYGDNSDFKGRICFNADNAGHYMMYCATNGCNFGGAPDAFLADAVRIAPISWLKSATNAVVQADRSLVADVPNRGWTVTYGTLRAPAGVTFTLKSPLTVANELIKDGAGTLALGCASTGDGKPFAVKEGYLMPLTDTCCAPFAVTFADGAGIELDAEATGAVTGTGLVAKSIVLAGKLKATIRNWKTAGAVDVKRAILTVPSTTQDLSDKIELVGRGAVKVLSKATDPESGTTTYFATFSKSGAAIILQ